MTTSNATKVLSLLNKCAANNNSAHNAIMDAWEQGSHEYAEARAAQDDLALPIKVLLAERDFERARAHLAETRLRAAWALIQRSSLYAAASS